MCIGLRHRVFQSHFKLIAAQRHISVVGDETVEVVKHKVVSQIITGEAGLLTRVDPAVLHPARTPGGEREVNSYLLEGKMITYYMVILI